jgi:hypothetical protein
MHRSKVPYSIIGGHLHDQPQPAFSYRTQILVACDLNATVATKVGMQSVFRHKLANPVFDDVAAAFWGNETRRGRCLSIKQHLWMRCAAATKCGSAFSTL